MSEKTPHTEWIAWSGLALCTFAILEHRAIKSKGARATLSHFLRHHTRKSARRQAASAIGYAAFSSWFAYHILYQELSDDGVSIRGI